MTADERTVVVPFKEALSGDSFVGFDRSYQWIQNENFRQPFDGNLYINFSYDPEKDTLVFEGKEENINDEENSTVVGGTVYLYPTENPEALVANPYEENREWALKYAEVLIVGSFTRQGVNYTVEVPMHED